MYWADTLHSEKQNWILRSNFSGETSGHNIILPYRWSQDAKSAKFFWYQEIKYFENYQECFVFTLENFLHVSI